MAVFRTNKNKNYTVMSNYHLKEKDMSLKAKGLLSMILSLPDDWDYSLSGLIAICKENETAIRSALKELQQFGYLRIDKLYPNKDRSKIEYVYNVFEYPQKSEENQHLENLYVENEYIENQVQLNTNKSNTNKSNNLLSKDNKYTSNSAKHEKSKKSKKEKAIERIIAKMEEYNFTEKVKERILDFYSDRMEKNDYPANNQLTAIFDMLTKVNEKKQLEAINNSIMQGYKGIFIPKDEPDFKKIPGIHLRDSYDNLEEQEKANYTEQLFSF